VSRVPLKDMHALLDRVLVNDDYGVYGSDFTHCLICGHDSGAGLLRRPGWHAADCPVPRLKRKYEARKPGAASKGEQA